MRRLVKDSNPPSPQHVKQPGQPLSGIQEIQKGKILLIQNVGELELKQKAGTGVANSPTKQDTQQSKDGINTSIITKDLKDENLMKFSDLAKTQQASVDVIVSDLEKEENLMI